MSYLWVWLMNLFYGLVMVMVLLIGKNEIRVPEAWGCVMDVRDKLPGRISKRTELTQEYSANS